MDAAPFKERSEDFLASISYALQRRIQVLFQVEEQEIAVTRIGDREHRRILFWEAAEGGNGVWSRLLQEPDALSKVAHEALRVCHFDEESGEGIAQAESCSRACYRCLLSYANQTDHQNLDRFLIRDYLQSLQNSVTSRIAKRSIV